MTPIVEAVHLIKEFRSHRVVDDLSFAIGMGEVYGFLGQNGAGKSTTMRIILGLIFPTSGKVLINGKLLSNSSRHLLSHTGAIIERPDMYGYLSGSDNLRMFGQLADRRFSKARVLELLEIVGLLGREQDKVKTYSQGMKQRLGIAVALSGNPDLLILDEPTNGLDPQGIADMRALITRLSKEFGKTVLISSHLLHEIEQVADRMLIIHKGKKIKEGKVSELISPGDTLFELSIPDAHLLLPKLLQSQWATPSATATQDTLILKLDPAQMPALNRWLVEAGAAVIQIRANQSLEGYFLSLTHDHPHQAGTV
jgi:ABC-type multidrug transport system ATPase subunit